MDREDAIAYGTEGLIQAVDNFDPTRGTTFASFAIRRIRGSILDAIRRMDVLPRSLRKSTRELDKANMELATMLGRWPTHEGVVAQGRACRSTRCARSWATAAPASFRSRR